MEYNQQLHVFPSGLRLVFIKTPNYYSAKFKLMVEVGSEDEPNPAGRAHLIEHSVFKGTNLYSQEEISSKFNMLSAEVDASTSSEFTVYKANFPKRNLSEVLGVFSNMLHDSVFDANEIKKEKQVIVEEILMHEDNPDSLVFDSLVKNMYSDSGIGNDIAGEIDLLNKLTIKELKEFHKSHYTASNFLISVIGDFNFGDVILEVEKHFEKPFSSKPAKTIAKVWSKPSRTMPKQIKQNKQINQANIILAFKTLPYENIERVKMGLIGFILGGSMSSRLFEKIRNELSLCYSIYAFDINYKNNGFLGISLATSNANKERAINAVNAEIEKVVKDGVSDEEFNIAKNLMLDKYLMHNDHAHVNLSYLSYTGKLFNQHEMINFIKGITKQDALLTFKKYINLNKEFISIVAPN